MEVNCLFVNAELKNASNCRKIVKMTDEKFGRVDILANYAGDTRRAT
jgi:NADP-dependent 3-hydroxy acid dehydrogenase YdfG